MNSELDTSFDDSVCEYSLENQLSSNYDVIAQIKKHGSSDCVTRVKKVKQVDFAESPPDIILNTSEGNSRKNETRKNVSQKISHLQAKISKSKMSELMDENEEVGMADGEFKMAEKENGDRKCDDAVECFDDVESTCSMEECMVRVERVLKLNLKGQKGQTDPTSSIVEEDEEPTFG